MNFLNALLGFAVLTGPLWLILIVLAIAIWIAMKVAKRFERRSARIAVGVLVFLLVFIVPFADEIAGRFYLRHLCANAAGVKVYQTVELPAEYWDEGGKPKIRTFKSRTPGTIRLVGINEPFWEERPFTESYSSLFHIDKAGFRLREINSKTIVGEIVYFRNWGGWVARNFSPHRSATSCELKNLDGWEYHIFKKAAGKT
jgi:hypothetical protein